MLLRVLIVIVFAFSVARPVRAQDQNSLQGHPFLRTEMIEPGSISPEAVLVIPFGEHKIYLLDKLKGIRKEWETPRRAFQGKLDTAGNLWLITKSPTEKSSWISGIIEKWSPDNKLLWTYNDPRIHHDLEPSPDGHLWAIRHSLLTGSLAKRLRSRTPGLDPACDSIVEIDPASNKEVSEISLADLLHLETQAARLWMDRGFKDMKLANFCHANSLRYYEKNQISSSPVLLVSVRDLNKVLLIEKTTHKILWSSPPGSLLKQHDARLYGKTVVVFNNNSRDATLTEKPSQVVTFDLGNGREQKQFFGASLSHSQVWSSPFMGGVERLSNGNFLVTLSGYSQVWEITPDEKVVWKLYVFNPSRIYELGGGIFRTESYP